MTNPSAPEPSQEEILGKAQKAFHDADLLSETGHAEDAVKALTQALDLYRRLPDTEQDQADCLYNTAVILEEAGQFDRSLTTYQQALDLGLPADPPTEPEEPPEPGASTELEAPNELTDPGELEAPGDPGELEEPTEPKDPEEFEEPTGPEAP